MLGFPGAFAVAVVFKELRKVFQGLPFPFMDLIRVDAILSGDLSDTFVFSDGLQDDLCFLKSR
jgi:hypothetical protein